MSVLPLNTWDQIAPRQYIRQVFCFPYQDLQNDKLQSLRRNLRSALDRACVDLPNFAGRVSLANEPLGHIVISKDVGDKAVLDVFDHSDTFPFDYQELKAQGFPARAFVGPDFDVPRNFQLDTLGSPATIVVARVIRGGLLLCVYVLHTITDGIGFTKFVSTFARYTRHHGGLLLKDAALTSHTQLPAETISSMVKSSNYEDLMERCPEFWTLQHRKGPLAFRFGPTKIPFEEIPKEGRIFVIHTDSINLLKETASRYHTVSINDDDYLPPSAFSCITALTWTFTTTSRLRVALRCSTGPLALKDFRIILAASWARRAFSDVMQGDTHHGNRVAMVKLEMGHNNLINADLTREMAPEAGKAFAKLVYSIEATLASLGEDFVATRTAMVRAAPDPRNIGLDHDPLDPRDFIFNSWRRLGADTQWHIPGIVAHEAACSTDDGGIRPEAVRRAQSAWNMSAGLILPGSKCSKNYEVLVTLDTMSMTELCSDERWMAWFDRVV